MQRMEVNSSVVIPHAEIVVSGFCTACTVMQPFPGEASKASMFMMIYANLEHQYKRKSLSRLCQQQGNEREARSSTNLVSQ
jgi:hypothetical protein